MGDTRCGIPKYGEESKMCEVAQASKDRIRVFVYFLLRLVTTCLLSNRMCNRVLNTSSSIDRECNPSVVGVATLNGRLI